MLNSVSGSALRAASIREGAALIEGAAYNGVEISLLDLSTPNATGTFKDWVACVTIAKCIQNGTQIFVTQSSGNTGASLVTYAERHGIRVIVFCPRSSRYKLPNCLKESRFSTLIEVQGSEREQKRITREFAELFDLPVLPNLEDQIDANKLRAYFLADSRWPRPFDWHVQALSSAYGIFGFYRGIEELGKCIVPPKLLGIQQEAVCPYFEFLSGRRPSASTAIPVIEPTLFRSNPPVELLAWMGSICRCYGGRVDRITNSEYADYSGAATGILEGAGLRIQSRSTGAEPQVREQAGLIALAGCLRAIDQGTIKPGEAVLVAITGGLSGNWDGGVVPRWMIHGDCTTDRLISLGRTLGLDHEIKVAHDV
ncbi:MAG: pyridoxal-phosphate dependent enzyme [Methylococcaceae bacterium]|nr:pyridoxal-phosphate dependent enzyme [Methylococcaceae bacterium]